VVSTLGAPWRIWAYTQTVNFLNENVCTSNVLPTSYLFSAQRGIVAQICNLPYRRFVIGRASEGSSALALADVPMATQFAKICNSPFYGSRETIGL